jgi:hypothetical protein
LAEGGGDLFALEVDDELLLEEDDELLLEELSLDEDDELLLEELSLDELLLLLEELILDELLLEELLLEDLLLLLLLPFVGATFSPGGLVLGDAASACRVSPPGPPFALFCRPGSDLTSSLLESFFSPAGTVFAFIFFLLLDVCPFRFVGTGSFVPVDNASSTFLVTLDVVPEAAAATLSCLETLLLLLVVMDDG